MTTDSIGAMIKKQVKPAVLIFLVLTLLVGILYPLVVTGIAQVVFPTQANGDLIMHNGKLAGSSQIGQPFSSPQYFWGRPSATTPVPYNAGSSTGSNLGPNNPALVAGWSRPGSMPCMQSIPVTPTPSRSTLSQPREAALTRTSR